MISPANHIRFLLVRAKKIAKWKTGLTQWRSKDKINRPKDKINRSKAVAEISVGWGGGAIAIGGNFHFIGSSETHELFYKTVIISKFPTN